VGLRSIGVIGLGLMGGGIARNLINKGFTVSVWDIDESAIARTAILGATSCKSPSDVGRQSDVVILVLPDAPQVEEVVSGERGLLAGARPGTFVVDCSTVDPAVTQAVGARARDAGCRMVDAAMGRGPREAEEGNLILMVGATASDFSAILPVLQAIGKDIFHCGGPGCGITMKVVNNLLANTILAADAEALVLGRKAGLNVDTMLNVLRSTSSDNVFLRPAIAQILLSDDHSPGFKSSLAHKDLRLGVSLAARLAVPLFVLGSALHLFSIVVAQGKGGLSNSVVTRVLQDLACVDLSRE
jgi:4-hydroxybutyrate dehydrogenase / sulfolactaldehyde 3-reductase